jgi:hypothetical protein
MTCDNLSRLDTVSGANPYVAVGVDKTKALVANNVLSAEAYPGTNPL